MIHNNPAIGTVKNRSQGITAIALFASFNPISKLSNTYNGEIANAKRQIVTTSQVLRVYFI